VKFAGLEGFQRAQWIRVVPSQPADDLLTALLDAGEAAVIALAREQGIGVVLIDERKARKVARDVYRLHPIGTARILVEAKRNGLLAEVAPALQELRRAGYWIHEDIVQAALREAGEQGDPT
jgi:predicted nucleic acid-binding protein